MFNGASYQAFLLKQSTATLYLLTRERLYLVPEGWSYTKGELCEPNLNSFCSVQPGRSKGCSKPNEVRISGENGTRM